MRPFGPSCSKPVSSVSSSSAAVACHLGSICFQPRWWRWVPRCRVSGYTLRKLYHAESRIMLRMRLSLAAVLMPIQLLFGHLVGGYVNTYQPSKMAAIEGRWNDEKPASEVLFAWPDVEHRRNLFAITLPPPFGSLIDADSLTAAETGLNSIPPENWPPVVIPFFAFRIMVGCGLVMLALAWVGSYF